MSSFYVSGETVELVHLTDDEIKAFFSQERKLHYQQGSEEGNLLYLANNDDDLRMMDVIALVLKGEIISFCFRPKYNTESILRLYTKPAYRGYGLASLLLNYCGTRELSCLKNNTNALRLYLSLGFVIKSQTSTLYLLERQ